MNKNLGNDKGAIYILFKELKKIQEKGVTKEELLRVKNNVKNKKIGKISDARESSKVC